MQQNLSAKTPGRGQSLQQTRAASIPVERTAERTDAAMAQDAVDAAQAARFRETGILTRSLIEAEDALEREREDHARTREALTRAEYASVSYQEVIASSSWRLTAPLRWTISKLRG